MKKKTNEMYKRNGYAYINNSFHVPFVKFIYICIDNLFEEKYLAVTNVIDLI